MPITVSGAAAQPLLSPLTISYNANGQFSQTLVLNLGSLLTQTGTLTAPDPNNDGKISVGELVSHDNPNIPILDPVPDINSQAVIGVGNMGGFISGLFVEYPILLVRQGTTQYLIYPDGRPDILTGVTGSVTTTLTFYRDGAYTPGTGVPCFAKGTRLRIAGGDAAVEDLRVGDLVWTVDRGLQPIQWIGSRYLGPSSLARTPALRPVRIAAGALGPNTPAQDLTVSPQHRVLVRSRIAQRMFGSDEILVAARQLVEIDGIKVVEAPAGVAYFHLLFDRHEVVMSNGALTESLYTGTEALKGVGIAAREEIIAIFPELRADGHVTDAARMIIRGRQGRQLAARHAKNAQALVRAA